MRTDHAKAQPGVYSVGISLPHPKWVLQIASQLVHHLMRRQQNLAVLLHEFREIGEEGMLLTQEIKLVVTLRERRREGGRKKMKQLAIPSYMVSNRSQEMK